MVCYFRGLSLANSVLLSIAIGLRGLYLLLGVLLMFLPVTMVTAFLRRHSSPPRLTIYRANVSLQAPVLKHQLAPEAKQIAFTVLWSLIAVVALVWVEHVPWVTHWSGFFTSKTLPNMLPAVATARYADVTAGQSGFDDNFRVADNLPRTSFLRFSEPRLRRYRRSSRAPLGRRMGCIFKDANCFGSCHLLSGQTSS